MTSGKFASVSTHSDEKARGLAWAFSALCAATYGLIVLGALVRANGAGLACPDWPLCFGEFVPTFDMRIAFEWGHRTLAGGVSLGLAALTALVSRRPALRQALRPNLILAWSLLGTQVLLGALTVLLLLAPWTVTAHLLIGNSFAVVLLWTARDLFEFGIERQPSDSASRVGLAMGLAGILLVLQMGLGGWVASHAAGLACTSFPTCNGESLVPTLRGMVGLHVIHRLNGFALVCALGYLAWTTRSSGIAARLSAWAFLLGLLQIVIGAMSVLFLIPVELTALHSATAAAIVLVMSLVLREGLRGWVRRRASRELRSELWGAR